MRARCDDCSALFEIEVPREPWRYRRRRTGRRASHGARSGGSLSYTSRAAAKQPAFVIMSPAATTRLSWHHSASIALQRSLIDFGPIGACSDTGGNCGDVTSLTA